MPGWTGRATSSSRVMQMHVVVEQPLSPLSYGRISVVPVGVEPLRFEWIGPRGTNVQLDATRSEASGLAPGRYTVKASDGDGQRAEVSVEVSPILCDAAVVDAYETTPASSGSASDGTVTAVGHGLQKWKRFIWTNGAETTGPVLRDVREGTYALSPAPVDGRVPVFVQRCLPAQVACASLSS